MASDPAFVSYCAERRLQLDICTSFLVAVMIHLHAARMLDLGLCHGHDNLERWAYLGLLEGSSTYPCDGTVSAKALTVIRNFTLLWRFIWRLKGPEQYLVPCTVATLSWFLASVSSLYCRTARAVLVSGGRLLLVVCTKFAAKATSIVMLVLWREAPPSTFCRWYLPLEGFVLLWQALTVPVGATTQAAIAAADAAGTFICCWLLSDRWPYSVASMGTVLTSNLLLAFLSLLLAERIEKSDRREYEAALSRRRNLGLQSQQQYPQERTQQGRVLPLPAGDDGSGSAHALAKGRGLEGGQLYGTGQTADATPPKGTAKALLPHLWVAPGSRAPAAGVVPAGEQPSHVHACVACHATGMLHGTRHMSGSSDMEREGQSLADLLVESHQPHAGTLHAAAAEEHTTRTDSEMSGSSTRDSSSKPAPFGVPGTASAAAGASATAVGTTNMTGAAVVNSGTCSPSVLSGSRSLSRALPSFCTTSNSSGFGSNSTTGTFLNDGGSLLTFSRPPSSTVSKATGPGRGSQVLVHATGAAVPSPSSHARYSTGAMAVAASAASSGTSDGTNNWAARRSRTGELSPKDGAAHGCAGAKQAEIEKEVGGALQGEASIGRCASCDGPHASWSSKGEQEEGGQAEARRQEDGVFALASAAVTAAFASEVDVATMSSLHQECEGDTSTGVSAVLAVASAASAVTSSGRALRQLQRLVQTLISGGGEAAWLTAAMQGTQTCPVGRSACGPASSPGSGSQSSSFPSPTPRLCSYRSHESAAADPAAPAPSRAAASAPGSTSAAAASTEDSAPSSSARSGSDVDVCRVTAGGTMQTSGRLLSSEGLCLAGHTSLPCIALGYSAPQNQRLLESAVIMGCPTISADNMSPEEPGELMDEVRRRAGTSPPKQRILAKHTRVSANRRDAPLETTAVTGGAGSAGAHLQTAVVGSSPDVRPPGLTDRVSHRRDVQSPQWRREEGPAAVCGGSPVDVTNRVYAAAAVRTAGVMAAAAAASAAVSGTPLRPPVSGRGSAACRVGDAMSSSVGMCGPAVHGGRSSPRCFALARMLAARGGQNAVYDSPALSHTRCSVKLSGLAPGDLPQGLAGRLGAVLSVGCGGNTIGVEAGGVSSMAAVGVYVREGCVEVVADVLVPLNGTTPAEALIAATAAAAASAAADLTVGAVVATGGANGGSPAAAPLPAAAPGSCRVLASLSATPVPAPARQPPPRSSEHAAAEAMLGLMERSLLPELRDALPEPLLESVGPMALQASFGGASAGVRCTRTPGGGRVLAPSAPPPTILGVSPCCVPLVQPSEDDTRDCRRQVITVTVILTVPPGTGTPQLLVRHSGRCLAAVVGPAVSPFAGAAAFTVQLPLSGIRPGLLFIEAMTGPPAPGADPNRNGGFLSLPWPVLVVGDPRVAAEVVQLDSHLLAAAPLRAMLAAADASFAHPLQHSQYQQPQVQLPQQHHLDGGALALLLDLGMWFDAVSMSDAEVVSAAAATAAANTAVAAGPPGAIPPPHPFPMVSTGAAHPAPSDRQSARHVESTYELSAPDPRGGRAEPKSDQDDEQRSEGSWASSSASTSLSSVPPSPSQSAPPSDDEAPQPQSRSPRRGRRTRHRSRDLTFQPTRPWPPAISEAVVEEASWSSQLVAGGQGGGDGSDGALASASATALVAGGETDAEAQMALLRVLQPTAELLEGSLDCAAEYEQLCRRGGALQASAAVLGMRLLRFTVTRGWPAAATLVLKGLLAHCRLSFDVILDAFPNTEGASSAGMPLLHTAVMSGRLAMVRAAVSWAQRYRRPLRWDEPAPDATLGGLTPLHLSAVLEDSGRLAGAILGVWPEAEALWAVVRDADGRTPQEYACMRAMSGGSSALSASTTSAGPSAGPSVPTSVAASACTSGASGGKAVAGTAAAAGEAAGSPIAVATAAAGGGGSGAPALSLLGDLQQVRHEVGAARPSQEHSVSSQLRGPPPPSCTGLVPGDAMAAPAFTGLGVTNASGSGGGGALLPAMPSAAGGAAPMILFLKPRSWRQQLQSSLPHSQQLQHQGTLVSQASTMTDCGGLPAGRSEGPGSGVSSLYTGSGAPAGVSYPPGMFGRFERNSDCGSMSVGPDSQWSHSTNVTAQTYVPSQQNTDLRPVSSPSRHDPSALAFTLLSLANLPDGYSDPVIASAAAAALGRAPDTLVQQAQDIANSQGASGAAAAAHARPHVQPSQSTTAAAAAVAAALHRQMSDRRGRAHPVGGDVHGSGPRGDLPASRHLQAPLPPLPPLQHHHAHLVPRGLPLHEAQLGDSRGPALPQGQSTGMLCDSGSGCSQASTYTQGTGLTPASPASPLQGFSPSGQLLQPHSLTGGGGRAAAGLAAAAAEASAASAAASSPACSSQSATRPSCGGSGRDLSHRGCRLAGPQGRLSPGPTLEGQSWYEEEARWHEAPPDRTADNTGAAVAGEVKAEEEEPLLVTLSSAAPGPHPPSSPRAPPPQHPPIVDALCDTLVSSPPGSEVTGDVPASLRLWTLPHPPPGATCGMSYPGAAAEMPTNVSPSPVAQTGPSRSPSTVATTAVAVTAAGRLSSPSTAAGEVIADAPGVGAPSPPGAAPPAVGVRAPQAAAVDGHHGRRILAKVMIPAAGAVAAAGGRQGLGGAAPSRAQAADGTMAAAVAVATAAGSGGGSPANNLSYMTAMSTNSSAVSAGLTTHTTLSDGRRRCSVDGRFSHNTRRFAFADDYAPVCAPTVGFRAAALERLLPHVTAALTAATQPPSMADPGSGTTIRDSPGRTSVAVAKAPLRPSAAPAIAAAPTGAQVSVGRRPTMTAADGGRLAATAVTGLAAAAAAQAPPLQPQKRKPSPARPVSAQVLGTATPASRSGVLLEPCPGVVQPSDIRPDKAASLSACDGGAAAPPAAAGGTLPVLTGPPIDTVQVDQGEVLPAVAQFASAGRERGHLLLAALVLLLALLLPVAVGMLVAAFQAAPMPAGQSVASSSSSSLWSS